MTDNAKRQRASMRLKIFDSEHLVHEIKGDELGVKKEFDRFFKTKYG